jgi:hypothetical protein
MTVTYFILEGSDNERLRADTPNEEYEIVRCPNGHMSVYRRIGDLALRVKHNKRDERIIWAWISGCVFHKSILAEFDRQGFTGYRLRPATVRFRDGTVSDQYQELVVTGWAGVARAESGIRPTIKCERCHSVRYSAPTDCSQIIDWNQWTGDDFFFVWPLPNSILITERVAELLLRLAVKSYRLGGFQDCDPIVWTTGISPLRLSNYLPADLMVKYGLPLGLE